MFVSVYADGTAKLTKAPPAFVRVRADVVHMTGKSVWVVTGAKDRRERKSKRPKRRGRQRTYQRIRWFRLPLNKTQFNRDGTVTVPFRLAQQLQLA